MRTHTNRSAGSLRWFLLVLLGLASIGSGPARAQTSPSQQYSFVGRSLPLSAAIEQLVNLTRIDLYYDTPLVVGKRSNCVIQEASAEEVLRCILEDTGLDFIRLSSGVYVITPRTETPPLFGKLRGIVVDADTGEPLPNAHVMLAEASTGTTANEAGMFAFARLKPGPYLVTATYVGYRSGSASVHVPPGGDTQAHLALESEPVLVAPLVVDGLQWRLPSETLGQADLGQEALLRAPSVGGSDVLLGLNMMLGVRVNDATADVHVQGGETGEHQLRLDGAPVFLPLGFASFVGPFSPFAVGGVSVHKAGFGASEGSQISGVIDIEQELSFPEPKRVDLQLDPLSLNARVGLHRRAGDNLQATVMAAGRTSLWELFAPASLQSLLDRWNIPDPFLKVAFDRSESGNPQYREFRSSGNPGIGFTDLHLASRLRFGLLHSLHSSFYWGTNHLGSDLADTTSLSLPSDPAGDAGAEPFRDRFTWQTGVAQTRYETVIGSRTLAALRLRGSYYRVSHTYNVPDSLVHRADDVDEALLRSTLDASIRPDDGNRIYEVAAEAALDHALGQRHTAQVGLELVRTGSRFVVLGTQRYPIQHEYAAWRVAGYAEDAWTIRPFLTLEGGSRLTYLPSHHAFYAEPRGTLRLDIRRSPLGPWSMRLSTGLYRQFVNQFDISSRSPGALLSSTRFWIVADSTIRPPKATHVAAEWLFKPSERWTLRLEGYHKRQHHTLAINYAARLDEGPTTELEQGDFIKASRGTVTGAGVQLARTLGPGRIEARYEYTNARRIIPGFFEGEPRAAPWNEPHRVELALDVVPLREITLLARWRGVWGRAWGFRQSYYDYLGAFGSKQGAELPVDPKVDRQIRFYELLRPDEHRLTPILQLDLSVAYARRIDRTTLQLRADVLNVLNRDNEAEWYLRYDELVYTGEVESPDVPSGYLLKARRPLLPRLVSVALRLTF